MASTSASSSIQKTTFKYDVFLSFQGEDTRKTFVDHLYHALHNRGILTYKDDEKIQKGEKINEQLITSIQDSRFHIIVFSKNYASSSWCLEELVHIMDCQKKTEHTAYPVFFDVEPREVRKQSGAVGKAFTKLVRGNWSYVLPLYLIFFYCRILLQRIFFFITTRPDLENEDNVGRWRNALKAAADLAGMELKNTFNGHEAKFIQQIVQDVSLNLFYSNTDGKLVGMETRVKKTISSLEIEADEVRMIGIWGIGGGGKTTLARVVFDHISFLFEGVSFVENVRERSEGYGLKELQKKVLRDVLNDKSIDVESVYEGKNMMKRMMPSRKVLIVLDDVDHIDQLSALAGSPNWFKPGSKIIITTRDKQVLVAHGIHNDYIHDVSLLSYEEAICLFSRHAFGREIPNQEYEELSRKVVHYAAGLPLTIKVLGSFLCGRAVLEWEDAIERLETIPEGETLKILELSYFGLEKDYKEMFLDIACILKGETKKKTIRILESCGFRAKIGLSVLEQKSLITIYEEKVLLHDRIAEMGRHIVQRLHPDDPRRHSRLWIKEEIEKILVNESGTEETKCIKLKYSDLHPVVIEKGLKKINALRFLHVEDFRDEEFDEVSQYLPDALQSLYWRGYPSSCLPKTFQAKKLINLEMCWSNITQLWEGGERKVLNNLKFLDLSYSKLRMLDLSMTPHLKYLNLSGSKVSSLNLGMTPNLEILHLEECDCLQEIHAPVGCLKKLALLKFEHWSRSECFTIEKHESAGLDSIATFEVSVKKKPVVKCQLHPNNNLPECEFECKYDELGSSWSGNLEKLISFGPCTCTYFEYVSAIVYGLQHLRELELRSSIPEVPKDLWQLQSLEKLSLWMKEIKRLPDSICILKHLKHLQLYGCKRLEQLPDSICRLECLEELHIHFCIIRDIPNNICKMKCLKVLDLSFCPEVEKLPDELGNLEYLKELNINGTGISRLPQSIFQLKGLCIIGLESSFSQMVLHPLQNSTQNTLSPNTT